MFTSHVSAVEKKTGLRVVTIGEVITPGYPANAWRKFSLSDGEQIVGEGTFEFVSNSLVGHYEKDGEIARFSFSTNGEN